VDRKTDICQVIIPDKDMKILQNIGVLGLLNVQEPCVIVGSSLAASNTTPSAAEEVLSKCKIPARVTTEEEEKVFPREESSEGDAKQALRKVTEKQNVDETRPLESSGISETKLDSAHERLLKNENREASLDNKGSVAASKGSVGTSKDFKEAHIEEPLGVKQDAVVLENEKSLTVQECPEQTKSIHKHDDEICSEKDESPVKHDLASQDDAGTSKSVSETEETTEHAQKSTDDATKSKPHASGVDLYKNKVLNILSYLRNYWANRSECQRIVLGR
jgi:hypothetical protein